MHSSPTKPSLVTKNKFKPTGTVPGTVSMGGRCDSDDRIILKVSDVCFNCSICVPVTSQSGNGKLVPSCKKSSTLHAQQTETMLVSVKEEVQSENYHLDTDFHHGRDGTSEITAVHETYKSRRKRNPPKKRAIRRLKDLSQHGDVSNDSWDSSCMPETLSRPRDDGKQTAGAKRWKPKKTFVCEHCSSIFQHASSLKVHARKHSRRDLSVCEVCAATFQHSGNLKVHMRKHTGERPYTCKECQSSFTQSSSLSIHRRTHSGERPFKCCICEAAFIHAGNLKVHLRKHTKERPFHCGKCEATFSQSGSLKMHMRRHSKASHGKLRLTKGIVAGALPIA